MVECSKCQFRQAVPGSPYCRECEQSRWKQTSGITFEEYYRRYFTGKSAFELLLDADAVLLDHAYYQADPDLFTPILAGQYGGDYSSEHEPMERLFLEMFASLFCQRLEAESGTCLAEWELTSIIASFEEFHVGIQRLMAGGVAVDAGSKPGYMGISRAWQLILLIKKCSAQVRADVAFIDDLARQFDPGSALFILELFVHLRSVDRGQAFRRLASAIGTDFSDLLREPVLLVTPWEHQYEAFAVWQSRGRRGIVEMATATGKTLVGILAIEALYRADHSATVRVLVHSRNILNQWRREVIEKLGLLEDEDAPYTQPIRIGRFSIHFNTVQSVSRSPEKYPTDLLIADEVHHFASLGFRNALSVPKKQVLGLSAYIEGVPRTRILERELGPTVYTLDLARAQEKGILPSFRWFVRAVELDVEEKSEFAKLSKDIVARFSIIRRDHLTIRRLGGKETELRDLGDFFRLVESARYRGQEIPQDWQILQGTVLKRRWLIHLSRPRMERAIELIIERARTNKVMVFAMNIESADTIARTVATRCDNVFVIHSEIKEDTFAIIRRFRDADHGVLIGIRMLEEGIDIPDADIGISVASSKTRLQLIQRMGRILRKRSGKSPVFVNFVAIPDASTYIGAEDNLTFLDDLAWIQDTALRMNLDLEMLDPGDPIWRTASEAERAFAQRYGGRSPDSIGKIGSFNIRTVLEKFPPEAVERLVGELVRFHRDHRLSDREWSGIVRLSFDRPKGTPLNIPGFWWLLVLADRHPGALIRLFRPGFDDADLRDEIPVKGEFRTDDDSEAPSAEPGMAPSGPDFQERTEAALIPKPEKNWAESVAGIAIGPAGTIYVADEGAGCVRQYSVDGTPVGEWGMSPSYDPGPVSPRGITTDDEGNVYVADADQHLIRKFTCDGKPIISFGGRGAGLVQFNKPSGVAVDGAGNIWVADTGNDRIMQIDPEGRYLGEWGRRGPCPGQFINPRGVAVDGRGVVYIADTGNDRVQVLRGVDKFSEIPIPMPEGDAIWGPTGPISVTVDSERNAYVADSVNRQVWIIQPSGDIIPALHRSGSDSEDDFCPGGVAVGADGMIFVTDRITQEIRRIHRHVLLPVAQPPETGEDPASESAGTGTDVPAGSDDPNLVSTRVLLPSPGPVIRPFNRSSTGSGKGRLSCPSDIAADEAGNIYVADENNHRVVKFTSGGDYLMEWGSRGSDGLFDSPSGIAVDAAGVVWVTDAGYARIQRFAPDGRSLGRWGRPGVRDGELANPRGIAFDRDGFVYIADSGNHRIQKFTPDGSFVGKWDHVEGGGDRLREPSDVAVDPNGILFVTDTGNDRIVTFGSEGALPAFWGRSGDGDGEMDRPGGIAIDEDGSVYVSDTNNNRIQRFMSDGTFLDKRIGLGAGRIGKPTGICIDPFGNVLVVDTHHNHFHTFPKPESRSDAGTSEKQGQKTPESLRASIDPGLEGDGGRTFEIVARWDGRGDDGGRVNLPCHIAVDGSGNIYVPDGNNNRIQKFSARGTLISMRGVEGGGRAQFRKPTGVATGRDGRVYVADYDNSRIQVFDKQGEWIREWACPRSGRGKVGCRLSKPTAIATDASGYVYVVDTENHRILIFTSSGELLSKWVGGGNPMSGFCSPCGIAVDGCGDVYVADTGNDRIRKFSSGGILIRQWGSRGSGAGRFLSPQGVAVDGEGTVWVTDTFNHRVQQFTAEGVYLGAVQDERGSGGVHNILPSGIALDRGGNIYVADHVAQIVYRIGQSGDHVESDIPGETPVPPPIKDADTCVPHHPGKIDGERRGDTRRVVSAASVFAEIDYPAGVAADSHGNVLVLDRKNNRVLRFAPNGTVLNIWGTEGPGEGQFSKPWGLTVDGEGNVLVADSGNNRIQRFEPAGTYLTAWGTRGKATGQFRFPVDLATDAAGNVWVVDRNNNRVQKFAPDGAFLGNVGGRGSKKTLFNHPSGIAIGAEGSVYVMDNHHSRVLRLSSDGAVVAEWGEYGNERGQFDELAGITVDHDGNVLVAEIGNHRIQVFSRDGRHITTWRDLGAGPGQIASPRGLAVDRNGNLYVADAGNGRILRLRIQDVVTRSLSRDGDPDRG